MRRASRALAGKENRNRVLTVLTCMLAGFLITTGALASRGGELRPNRNTDMVQLLRDEARRTAELTRRVTALRAEVDELGRRRVGGSSLEKEIADAAPPADLTALHGPSVTVTLADAPLSVKPAGVDEELLVVHQQDIQAVANALWSGGAEAMTIQGQRVTARTGIKCVGNSVVLHGTPYAPPYVITAVGDPAAMEAALESSEYLRIYRQYVTNYRLGWSVTRAENTVLPPFRGTLDLNYAKAVR